MSKEKDQHINVFVRIKPVSTTDTSEKCATTVVEMVSDKEITVYERSQDKSMKVFTFDGVFGPSSTQMDVYSTVISPLLKEVIAGYNCTVFAYGQTGTGKTYTMEGDRVDNLNWQSGSSAGMIPRCLSHLFDELQKLENQQYTVRVNFLELYNEELLDLLTDGNDSSKIKLYEDVTKKGSVIVHGLDEVTVRSKAEIYKILEKGSERRKTAATMLNTHSSRSHTVFTITIHTKENTSVGEELLKTAKLNLVDLAGSEHVGRSGAVDKRAREARSINQSLLTLGRVITALVEKAPHIPYRESKLTRLLQESLGGRTKTSIIATVSSVSHSLEETLSTLDYAHRAKNITNCPEINQKVCRKALLKEYTNEIERLKRDLLATREKNGIYVPLDDYDTMQTLIGHQRKEINKKKDYCKTLEEVMENKEKIFNDLQSQYDAQVVEVMRNTDELKNTNYFLQRTKECLRRVERDKNERKQLAEKYAETEKILLGKMGNLLSVVTEASQDAQKLHDKLDLKRKVEEENEKLGLQMKDDFTKRCRNIEDVLLVHKNEIHNLLQFAKDEVETRIIAPAANIEASIGSIVESAVYQHFVDREESKKDLNTSYTHYQKVLNTHMKDTNSVMENENKLLTDIYSKLAPDIHDLVRSNYNESLMQHLQYLNRNISQKLESVSMYTKHAVETVCRNRFEEYNYLRKSLSEISEHINSIARNEKQVMENYKEFGKKMEDLSCGFNLLDKCEGNYSGNIDTSHQIDQVCSNVYDQNSHNCNADITKQNDLNDFLQNITSLVKSDIDSGINQAQISNKTLTEKGNILVCDLQERLSTGRAMLTRYNNNVQSSGEQLQQKMIKDKDRLFASSANSFKAAKNMDLTHIDLMKKQKNKISDFSRVMDNKITNQHMELNNFNNNIVEELRASQQQIDKFLSEDIRRDIRTGTTPEKKEFSYPRELAVSPPGQIIQRFRESREHLNGTEDNLDSTTEQIYLLKVDNMEKPPNKNRAPFVTSTPYNNPNAVYLNNCSSESIFPTDLPGSSES